MPPTNCASILEAEVSKSRKVIQNTRYVKTIQNLLPIKTKNQQDKTSTQAQAKPAAPK